MIRQLRQWSALLIGYIETRIKGKMPAMSEDETISRFIFQKTHFAATKGVVKYGAFMPEPNNVEVSVYRTTGVSRRKKWALCFLFVEPFTKRRAKACADVKAKVVLQNTLSFNADGKPQRRHANIVGWSHENSHRMSCAKAIAEKKAHRMSCAKAIAKEAAFDPK